MTPLGFTLAVLGISYLAGLLGSLVGVGGGIVVVPALTLLMGVGIENAIAASIVSVCRRQGSAMPSAMWPASRAGFSVSGAAS